MRKDHHKENSKITETPVNENEEKIDGNKAILEEISQGKNQLNRKRFLSHLFEKMSKKEFSLLKHGIGGIFDEYQNYQNQKQETIQKFIAYETVVDGATDTNEYYILLLLSCLIATMGLYQNSPAVIIGAMIVAPLMGPVFGFSAGVLWGSGKVIWEAVTTLAKGTALVILLTSVMTLIIPGIVITEEMMARSRPTLFDTIVALACGFVGAYAYVNKRVSMTIPGVAISVALMPPVCTIGIGIGMFNWELAIGSLLLYVVNLLGISLASVIIFYFIRLNPKVEDEEEMAKVKARAYKQIIITFGLLLIISVPLVYFMATTIQDNQEEDKIYQVIAEVLPDEEVYTLEVVRNITNKVEVVFLHTNFGPITNLDVLKSEMEIALDKVVLLNVFTIHQYQTKISDINFSNRLENLIHSDELSE